MPTSYALYVDQREDTALSGLLSRISVDEGIEAPSTFTLEFLVDLCHGEFPVVDDTRVQPDRPDRTVSVVVTVRTGHGEQTSCLIRGVVTRIETQYTRGGAGSRVLIEGEDRSVLLDRDHTGSAEFRRASDSARALAEDVFDDLEIEDSAVEYPESNPLRPGGNIRDYLNTVAGRSGMRLWVRPDFQPGPSPIRDTFHFGYMPPRGGSAFPPAPTPLVADVETDFHAVSSEPCRGGTFKVSTTGNHPTEAGTVSGIDDRRGERLDAEVSDSEEVTMGARPATSSGVRATLPIHTGVSIAEREAALRAALDDASWFVTAEAETTVDRFGELLRPGQILNVVDVGRLDRGPYFIKRVRHDIDAASHRMHLELMRNARGSSEES